MSVGALAIIGFCLQVMFNRKFQCDADVEIGTAGRENFIKDSSRYPSGLVFNISGRLPPPPPLSPPPPPADGNVVEISHFSNTSFTYISESDYESMQEMTSSSDDTTMPAIVFTTDLSTVTSQQQAENPRSYDVKTGSHITPKVSVIAEEDEDTAFWDIRSERGQSRTPSKVSMRTTESTSDFLPVEQTPLHVPDTETGVLQKITVPKSNTVLSPVSSTSSTTAAKQTSDDASDLTPQS